jgi:hypothetical protein
MIVTITSQIPPDSAVANREFSSPGAITVSTYGPIGSTSETVPRK